MHRIVIISIWFVHSVCAALPGEDVLQAAAGDPVSWFVCCYKDEQYSDNGTMQCPLCKKSLAKAHPQELYEKDGVKSHAVCLLKGVKQLTEKKREVSFRPYKDPWRIYKDSWRTLEIPFSVFNLVPFLEKMLRMHNIEQYNKRGLICSPTLHNVQELDLSGALQGAVCPDLRDLARLRSLRLDNNVDIIFPNVYSPESEQATSVFPPSLEKLCLNNCGLERVSKVLKHLALLTQLFMNQNQDIVVRSGDIPKSLRLLSLNDCGLTVIPEAVVGLKALEVLALSGNEDIIIDPDKLSKELKTLYVKGCREEPFTHAELQIPLTVKIIQ